jgi:hypothetical protein
MAATFSLMFAVKFPDNGAKNPYYASRLKAPETRFCRAF